MFQDLRNKVVAPAVIALASVGCGSKAPTDEAVVRDVTRIDSTVERLNHWGIARDAIDTVVSNLNLNIGSSGSAPGSLVMHSPDSADDVRRDAIKQLTQARLKLSLVMTRDVRLPITNEEIGTAKKTIRETVSKLNEVADRLTSAKDKDCQTLLRRAAGTIEFGILPTFASDRGE